jgi:hypothetical protein
MIVFQHQLMGQVRPVALAPARQHRVDIQGSKPGGGFAGVEDSAARALNRIHKAPSGTCNARSALQQIQ